MFRHLHPSALRIFSNIKPGAYRTQNATHEVHDPYFEVDYIGRTQNPYRWSESHRIAGSKEVHI